MSDVAVKKRLERAKRNAVEHFMKLGYSVFNSDNKPVCFFGFKEKEIIIVRVAVDAITHSDKKALSDFTNHPDNCHKGIFCQKQRDYEFRDVD